MKSIDLTKRMFSSEDVAASLSLSVLAIDGDFLELNDHALKCLTYNLFHCLHIQACKIKFSREQNVSLDYIKRLISAFVESNIQRADLTHFSFTVNEDFAQKIGTFLAGLPKLISIDLSFNGVCFNPESFANFSALCEPLGCHGLKELKLLGNLFGIIPSSFENVEVQPWEVCFELLSRFPLLEHLDLSRNYLGWLFRDMEDAAFERLLSYCEPFKRSIKKLSLADNDFGNFEGTPGADQVCHRFVRFLSVFGSVNELDLSKNSLSNIDNAARIREFLGPLRVYRCLKILNLSGNLFTWNWSPPVYHAFGELLAGCSDLHTINLSGIGHMDLDIGIQSPMSLQGFQAFSDALEPGHVIQIEGLSEFPVPVREALQDGLDTRLQNLQEQVSLVSRWLHSVRGDLPDHVRHRILTFTFSTPNDGALVKAIDKTVAQKKGILSSICGPH